MLSFTQHSHYHHENPKDQFQRVELHILSHIGSVPL